MTKALPVTSYNVIMTAKRFIRFPSLKKEEEKRKRKKVFAFSQPDLQYIGYCRETAQTESEVSIGRLLPITRFGARDTDTAEECC